MSAHCKSTIGFLSILLAGLLLCSHSYAAKTCYDCHKKEKADYNSRKFLHAPLKNEDCESCHLRHGFAQQLVLKSGDNELCFSCHGDIRSKFDKDHVHFPVEKSACWECHDPHGSNKKALLKQGPEGNDDPASCFGCHLEDVKGSLSASHSHPPFAELKCLTCHEPHSSTHEALLKQEPNALCASCHPGNDQKMVKGHEGRFVGTLPCIDCHSGHSSNNKGLLSDKSHPPFADGDCESCHSLPGSDGQVTFEAGANKSTVCADCHDEQAAGSSKAFPHEAVAPDNCLECHKPHASRQEGLLVKPQDQLCGECHSEVLAGHEGLAKHAPVILGECSSCHEVHGSDHQHLVKTTGKELCLGCHTQFAKSMDSAHTIHKGAENCLDCHSPHEGKTNALLKDSPDKLCASCHEPSQKSMTAVSAHQPYLVSNCIACHKPHFSDKEHLVRAEGSTLCRNCHGDIFTRTEMTHPHPPATEDCLTCHAPHHSDKKSLLTANQKDLCIECHDLAEIGGLANNVHTPVKNGDCSGCHDPHGSSQVKLLSGRSRSVVSGGVTMKLPVRMSDKKSDLCFSCHEAFEQKLHTAIPHAPVQEGKCDACHSSHGSNHNGFVKEAAPALCLNCHKIDSKVKEAHSGYDVAASNCLGCHNPHISSKPKLVRANTHPPFAEKDCESCHEIGDDGKPKLSEELVELCGTCHDVVASDMALVTKHPPFEAGECTSCHNPHTSDTSKLLVAAPGKLCVTCHEDIKALDSLAVQHPPFAEGKCMDCHKPHASAHTALLTKPKEALCYSCHTELKEQVAKGVPHQPVAGAKCEACHLPHAGSHGGLLVTSKQELCQKCHQPSPAMTASHKGFDISSADCQNCHAPHVGTKGVKGLLLPNKHKPFADENCQLCHANQKVDQFVAEKEQLCLSCHKEMTEQISRKVVHQAVVTEKTCNNCHGPHVGFGEKLLRKEGYLTCIECHDKKEFSGTFKHEPAFEDCNNCHNPHSADFKGLLSENDIMSLCMSCHDDAKEKHFHPMGAGVIDPRTKEPVNCVGCHSPHSSDFKGILTADKDRKLCNLCHATAHE
jgi:predicted CXXCH cytochrome family protein